MHLLQLSTNHCPRSSGKCSELSWMSLEHASESSNETLSPPHSVVKSMSRVDQKWSLHLLPHSSRATARPGYLGKARLDRDSEPRPCSGEGESLAPPTPSIRAPCRLCSRNGRPPIRFHSRTTTSDILLSVVCLTDRPFLTTRNV